VNYLVIDTTSAYLGIVYKTAEKEGVYTDSSRLTHSQTLMPAIEAVLGGGRLKAIDYVGVVTGPGSFTGIRIGITAAKAFAFADSRLKLIGVDSLKAKVAGMVVPPETEYAVAVIDGGNKVFYAAVYSDGIEVLKPCALAAPELVKFLDSIGEPCAITGDIGDLMLPKNFIYAESVPEAGLKTAFLKEVQQENFLDYNSLNPLYIQLPQAEKDFRRRD